jgi:O-antigen/teichoic acid export membrane protein
MKPNFVRHLGLMLLGASAARALSFANLLLAARLYSKDDFGGLALALGFVGLVQPFLTLRYEIAVVLARTNEAARSLVYGVLGIALCIYAVVALLVVAAPGLLAGLIRPDVIAGLRAPVLLHLAASVVIVSLTAWLQKHKAFGTIAASQFVGALGTAVLVLGAPFVVEATLTALVWGYAGGALLSALILAAPTPRSGLFRLGVQSGRIWRLLAKYRVYPTYSLPLTISSLISDRALLLYLSGAFSLGTLGGFYSVRQLLFGLVHLVTSSINQVVFPYISQNA